MEWFGNKNPQLHKAGGTLCVSVKRQPTRKWHIWFFPRYEPTLKKPKEPFFPMHGQTRLKIFYTFAKY